MKREHLLLTLLVAVVFFPCLGFQFLHWDDYSHYISNPCVYSLSWRNIFELLQQTINDTYIPLTTLSFNVEYHLFGLSPFVSHLINGLLHLGVVLAICHFARQLKFSHVESFMAAAIFAVHPIHVESVAWVTERKDVLGGLFYILCLQQYWRYLQTGSKKNYGISLLLALFSVLAKAMAVSLPWVLLLLDWFYRRQPGKKMWLDKMPFAALIFPVAAVTFFKLSPHPHIEPKSILIGLWTFAWYLEKFVWPLDLLPVYTAPSPVAIANFVYIKSFIIFAAFCVSLFIWRKNRLFLFACLFWVATSFFFWRFDLADINIVADRFMYLPSLGFCLLLGKYLPRFKIVSAVLLTALGFLAFNQCQIWRSDLTLWTWTLSHDPKNALAKDKRKAAIYHPRRSFFDYKALTEAIDKNPGSFENYMERAQTLLKDTNFYLAFNDFPKAIKADPSNYEGYTMRGWLYLLKGDYKNALRDLDKAIALNPGNAMAYKYKAAILGKTGETQAALLLFEKAIALNPHAGGTYYQRGQVYKSVGQFDKAIEDFSQSIRLKDSLGESYYQRGQCYNSLGRSDNAVADFQLALKEDPYDSKTWNELGVMYLKQKRFEQALSAFDRAISIDPYFDRAYNNRGIVHLEQKHYDLARQDFTNAIETGLQPYRALITRGDIYFVTGEWQKALDDFGRAMVFSDGDPTAGMKFEQARTIILLRDQR